ncbi:polysaccharide pyruvyl transferase family protein [Litoreibacter roseus]|uniref:GumL protein n=1 Tax=Litoreibacter roseus TaxID=2601869 RepID=A0A6N6JIR0_9RHOB|nr:polysaccharide pyruvyl transferase family protein [Litoreibacter roseus]GFE66221.1 GumL protein [Litoreibacter roseus]
MTDVRTFYWHDRVKGRRKLFWDKYVKKRKSAWKDFAIGNAGDIFARNLVSYFYPGANPVNVKDGPRILCVGSIGHKLQPGDVLSGIGCKTTELPSKHAPDVMVHGLRGPISFDAYKAAGFDVSRVAWLADPGLLIAKMLKPAKAKPGRVSFIPHYREREEIRKLMPAGMKIIDIDDDPLSVGKSIQKSELIYTSSLHGAVFAHALDRPVVLIKPATEEPLLKYEDYYLAVGLGKPVMLDSIIDADFATAPNSPASLTLDIDTISFPAEATLREKGILL